MGPTPCLPPSLARAVGVYFLRWPGCVAASDRGGMLRVVDLDVYTGPVPPSLFAPLFMVSLVFGIGLLAYFFVYVLLNMARI